MQQGQSTTGRRGRSTAAQVDAMRAAYLAAPHHCLQCDKPILPHAGEKIHETMRRKFCSRSCAASYNNRSAVAPKKKAKPRFCGDCGVQVATTAPEGTRILCVSCSEGVLQRLPSLRRDEASSAAIRRHVRHVLTDRPRVCAHCGYAWHVETVHLRPVDDFPPDATLATIDDPANLAYLCPNHRWEYEHGLITLDPTTIARVHPYTGRRPPMPTSRKRPLRQTAVASR
jgi:hypothetical protein